MLRHLIYLCMVALSHAAVEFLDQICHLNYAWSEDTAHLGWPTLSLLM